MSCLAISLRQVTLVDQEFLLRVYSSTRSTELALTGWDDAACDAFIRMQFNAQLNHYQQHWPNSEHSVIEVEIQGINYSVGRLWVDRRFDSIHILEIALLPDWRNRCIGYECLRFLMKEVSLDERKLTIQVEQDNPARRLYDRLGFKPVGPQQGLHQWMAWRKSAGSMSHQEEACYEQA